MQITEVKFLPNDGYGSRAGACSGELRSRVGRSHVRIQGLGPIDVLAPLRPHLGQLVQFAMPPQIERQFAGLGRFTRAAEILAIDAQRHRKIVQAVVVESGRRNIPQFYHQIRGHWRHAGYLLVLLSGKEYRPAIIT